MNDLQFKFYSVVKNEDANPYLKDDYMIVADGLGGSGGFNHTITQNDLLNVKSLFSKVFLQDFDLNSNSEESSFYNTLIEPLCSKQSNTSATWASRMVMARMVNLINNYKNFNYTITWSLHKHHIAFLIF